MTKEEKQKRDREKAKRWYHRHKEKAKELSRAYYHKHKEERYDYHKSYTKTPMGRAVIMVRNHKMEDKKHNRGEVNYDAKWVVENILNKPCVHCGETDWHNIGCNRIDNTKPHTKDNVEPCCFKCNLKLNGKDCSKKTYQYTSDKQLIRVYRNLKEASQYTGIPASTIQYNRIKNNITKQGYIWSLKPL